MSSMQENTVTLRANDSNYTVARVELNDYWTGNYLLVWRTPPDHRVSILPGDSGRDIIWLDAHLSKIRDNPPRVPEDLVFDAVLHEQVKMFQLSAGLIPDGIVGPKTWIQINSRVLQDVPMIIDYSE